MKDISTNNIPNCPAMRLWSLHPRYLDRQWLLAVWREGLLAQKVLQGRTKGYRNHPQLIRFRACANPLGAIGYYLSGIVEEARNRGYSFDNTKIFTVDEAVKISVTTGQIEYEREHLLRKLAVRDHSRTDFLDRKPFLIHPIFSVSEWDVEDWEMVKG